VKSNGIQEMAVPGETWARSSIVNEPVQRLAGEPRRAAGNLGVLAEARTPAPVSLNHCLIYSSCGSVHGTSSGINGAGNRTGCCLPIAYGIRRVLRVLQGSTGHYRVVENSPFFVVDGKLGKAHSVPDVA